MLARNEWTPSTDAFSSSELVSFQLDELASHLEKIKAFEYSEAKSSKPIQEPCQPNILNEKVHERKAHIVYQFVFYFLPKREI
jgi:hypothetical protein